MQLHVCGDPGDGGAQLKLVRRLQALHWHRTLADEPHLQLPTETATVWAKSLKHCRLLHQGVHNNKCCTNLGWAIHGRTR